MGQARTTTGGMLNAHRHAVLDAIVRSRTPGWSFTGHLLGISYDRVSETNCMLRCVAMDRVYDDNGRIDFGAVAVLGDLALGICCREAADAAVRMATVSMTMTMHGTMGEGDLTARGQLCSYQPRSRVSTALARIFCGKALLCTVNAVFLALPAPDHLVTTEPLFRGESREDTDDELTVESLSEQEAKIYARVDSGGVHAGDSFLRRFWGFDIRKRHSGASGRLEVGPHTGNRVGHVQGGILFAFASEVAKKSSGSGFELASMHATYHRPGEGGVLEASALRAHQGRTTEVVNTVVTDHGGSTVLFTQSTFNRT
jgi:uncharacterized protein (TIGR00369 family)